MMWNRIPKETSIAPSTGRYPDWKPQLSVEGYHQCVYCCISENSFGGIRNFHVEHYKPKGIPRFAHLEQDYFNLYYACAICNSFKSDDWPNDPDSDFQCCSYPEPSRVNYKVLFEIHPDTGKIEGKNIAGTYIVNKLFLNRAQLIIERKVRFIEYRYKATMDKLSQQKEVLFSLAKNGNREALEILEELDKRISALQEVFHLKDTTRPYVAVQIKK